MSSSSDHRCLNTGTLLETPDTQEDNAHNKNIAKGPNISSGEKEGGGAKEANGSKSSSRRTTTGKKQSTTAAQSQAPRHKKQHSSDSKKITPESANDKAVASSALSASVESLPPLPSTPSSSSSSNAFSAEPQQDTKLSEDRLSLMRTSALPIDIPASSEDLDRRTPLSDCSSSIGQKSYVQDGFVHESSAASNTNSVDTSCSSLAKPKFMMMHKEYTQGTSAANVVSNGLGFSPFGMNPTAPNILQDICSQDNIMTNTQPVSRVMPAPPGLSSVVTMHSGNWPAPNSRLCDSMPIQSSHDWEAAFGFKSSANETGVSSVDDELGFDPWLECSKGFADLMKEEKHTKTTSDTNLGNTVPQSSMAFQNLLAQTSRPSFAQDRNLPKSSQAGLSDLVNGFSNLFTNPAQIYPQQRMPFSSEQSRFLPQQRLVPDMHASLGQNQQKRQFGNAGMHLPPSKDPQLLKGDGNIQEIQNEFRALLPSVNINFTHQNHAQRSASQNLDLSLGLSNLGMPMGGAPHKQPISQPPGIGSLPIQNNPFMNKQHVMSPTGFNNRHSQIRHAWGGLDSAFSNQGMSSNRIPEPAGMHSLFPGVRSEPEVASPSYPPDPAIIQGQGFNPTMRRNRLFENSFAGPGMGNQNNNGSDEQPHWMKSLQSMMDHDSPTSPQPASSHSQGFPQQRTNNNMPSWPNMSNLFPSNSASFNNSQPPPGFQVRPTLSKPTEFGAFQNLLENQS